MDGEDGEEYPVGHSCCVPGAWKYVAWETTAALRIYPAMSGRSAKIRLSWRMGMTSLDLGLLLVAG